MTFGSIPQGSDCPHYGDIRDRECVGGGHWLQPGLKAFYNTRLQENNQEWSDEEKREYLKKKYPFSLKSSIRNVIFRFAVLKRGYLWLARQRQILREWRGNVYPVLKDKYHNRKLAFLVLTPEHGNLGDHAIAKAAGKMLASAGISYMEISTDWLCALRRLNCLDIFDGNRIFINGGGNIGTLWPEVEQMMQDVVRNNPNSPIVILPNTAVYEHDSGSKGKILKASREVYDAHRNLTIFAREKISCELLKKHFFMQKSLAFGKRLFRYGAQ